jgi:hypothetical protein
MRFEAWGVDDGVVILSIVTKLCTAGTLHASNEGGELMLVKTHVSTWKGAIRG